MTHEIRSRSIGYTGLVCVLAVSMLGFATRSFAATGEGDGTAYWAMAAESTARDQAAALETQGGEVDINNITCELVPYAFTSEPELERRVTASSQQHFTARSVAECASLEVTTAFGIDTTIVIQEMDLYGVWHDNLELSPCYGTANGAGASLCERRAAGG